MDQELFTFSSLRRLVQASDEQLHAQLHSIAAYDVDGHYRLLHERYEHSLVHDIINAIVETRQSVYKVDTATVVATIAHLHPPTMARQCLHSLAAYSARPTLDQPHIMLCPERLSRHLAHALFNAAPPASHCQPADTVIAAITSGLPAPLVCQPAYLLSIAVVLPSTASTTPSYRYLPAHMLPSDVKGRLSALFAVKDKWTAEEMAAWTADVLPVAAKPDSALLKHARPVTEKDANGNKTVCYVSNAHS